MPPIEIIEINEEPLLDDSSIKNKLVAIDAFINGASTKSLDETLSCYDNDMTQLNRDFHQTKINQSDEIHQSIIKILKSLNVSQEEQDSVNPEQTIYEFLASLAQNGHPQLIYLVDQLDNKKRFRFLKMLLGPGIVVSFIATVFSIAAFHLLIEFLRLITSSLIAFPIIGLISNTFLNIYYIIINQADSKKTLFNRVRDLIFILSSAAIQISAYIFLIVTGVATSPIAGAIFVSGSIFNVFKEIFCLFQEVIIYKSKPYITENEPLYVHKAYARREFEYQKRVNALAINLLCALIVVGISVFWSFVPGGLPIAITALTAMSVVFLIKIACIKYNEYRLRERLQTQLHELDEVYIQQQDQVEAQDNIVILDPLVPVNNQNHVEEIVIESPPRRRAYSDSQLKRNRSSNFNLGFFDSSFSEEDSDSDDMVEKRDISLQSDLALPHNFPPVF